MDGGTIKHSYDGVERGACVRTAVEKSIFIKRFLQLAQSLPVTYGYTRGIREEANFITYQEMGTPSINVGIGNQLISERTTYVITVQTETAKKCMFYTELIKIATESSEIQFVSDSVRPDVTVKNRWINTIYVQLYNGLVASKSIFTEPEVRSELQKIANRYIYVTSIYLDTVANSFIDKFVVPQLEDKLYTYEELMELKQEYIDRLLYTTTKY